MKTTMKIGFWSAVLTAFFGLAFIAAALLEIAGLISGPERFIPLMLPSFFLAPAFVVLMSSIYLYAPEDKKIWGLCGLGFALIYAALITIVYFTQLSFVLPNLIKGEAEKVAPFLFIGSDSFMFGLDVLGYGFMSLATLFSAFVFAGTRLRNWVRYFMLANGLLAPLIPLEMFWPALIYPAGLWIITFPGATILLAILFKQEA